MTNMKQQNIQAVAKIHEGVAQLQQALPVIALNIRTLRENLGDREVRDLVKAAEKFASSIDDLYDAAYEMTRKVTK